MSKKYRKIFTNLMAGSMLLGSVATMAMSCGSSTSKEKEKPSPVAPEQPSNPAKPDTKNDTPSDSTNNDSKNELKLSLDKVTEYLKTLSDAKYAELRQELEQEYQRANSIYSSNSTENDAYVSAKINLDKAYEKTVENKKLIDNKPTDVPPVEEDTKQDKDEEKKSEGDTTTESEDKTKDDKGGKTSDNEDETTTKTDEESSKENQGDKTEGSETGKTDTESEGESASGESEDKTKEDKGGETSNNKDETTAKTDEESSKENQEDKTNGKDSESSKTDTESEGESSTGESGDKTKTEGDKDGDKSSDNEEETTAKTDEESSKENKDDKREGSETGNDQAGTEDANVEKTTEDSKKELNYEYVEVKKIISNTNVKNYLSNTFEGYSFKNYDGSDLDENKVMSNNETIKLLGTKTEGSETKYALLTLKSTGYQVGNLNNSEFSTILTGRDKINLDIEKSYYDYHNPKKPNETRATELPKLIDGNKEQESRWDNWFDYAEIQDHNTFYLNLKDRPANSKIHGMKVWVRVSGFNANKSWGDFDKYNHSDKVQLQNGKTMSPEWIKIYSSSTNNESDFKLVSGQDKVLDNEFFNLKVENNYKLIDEDNLPNGKTINSNIFELTINFEPTTDKYFKFSFEAPTIPNLKDPEGTVDPKFKSNKGFIGFSELEFIELKEGDSINSEVEKQNNASTSFTALEQFGDSFKLNIDNKEVELNGNEQTLSIQVPEGKTFEEVFRTLFDNSTIKNSDNSNLQEGIYTFGYVSEVTTNAKTQKETGAKTKVVVTDGTTEHKKEFTINLTKTEVSTPTEETN
ncbi:hypothetical protein [Mycoplasma sp. CSL10166]|uniref:hypothetical protein n=1 Tax=Mycoplasma sp. CSL10166 TaxID=2813825 RepID=UPI00197B9FF4|nr:hypothetical protein [Mycoplasma sp. CSL10166]MBN4084447.1 hypothetical protein [Mycoplasma sp. CSL10166]